MKEMSVMKLESGYLVITDKKRHACLDIDAVKTLIIGMYSEDLDTFQFGNRKECTFELMTTHIENLKKS